MLNLMTNPIFILVLVILIILAIVIIINNNLTGRRKKNYRLINENRDYLESQIEKYKKTLDELINEFVTDQTITDILVKTKNAINIDNTRIIDNLINVENEMYRFINNPAIKAEEYTKINDTLTKLYSDSLTDVLKNERNNYNTEATSYNTKLEDFPASLLAKIFKYQKLPLFEDSITKNVSTINNSASYLSSNYQINQETIKSPEAQKEDANQKSNLYLAKQHRVDDTPNVVIPPKEEPSATVVEPISVVNPETPTNDNPQPEPTPENSNVEVTSEPITEPSSENNSKPVIKPAPVVNPEPVSESAPVVTDSPASTNNEIELVNPIAASFSEPISINEETPSTNIEETPTETSEIEFVNNDSNQIAEPISLNDDQPSIEEPISIQEPNPTSIENPEPSEPTIEPEKVEETPVIEESTPAEVQEEQPTTETEEEKPERYCPNCHKITTEAFCPDCGYPTE